MVCCFENSSVNQILKVTGMLLLRYIYQPPVCYNIDILMFDWQTLSWHCYLLFKISWNFDSVWLLNKDLWHFSLWRNYCRSFWKRINSQRYRNSCCIFPGFDFDLIVSKSWSFTLKLFFFFWSLGKMFILAAGLVSKRDCIN